MFKLAAVICALFGLFVAVSLAAWLRKHTVKSKSNTYLYEDMRGRDSEFWKFQYLPLVSMLVVAGGAVWLAEDVRHAAVFLAGALLCYAAVLLASKTTTAGYVSSSSLAVSGNVRDSLKASYRSAAVAGLGVICCTLLGLCVLFVIFNTSQLIDYISSFTLGVAVVSLCLALSGNVYAISNSIVSGRDDSTYYTGMSIGIVSDYTQTYVLSACAALLLAGVGVDTSGITSTFTVASAAVYPLIILATGTASSALAVLSYRARVNKDPASGITAGNFVAAIITGAVSLYFSLRILQSYLYAFCVIAGIVSVLVPGEMLKSYSADGSIFKKYVPGAKSVGTSQSMIYSLSAGMISVIIPSVVTMAAMVVSYYFANYYGIALAAAGINSMAAVNSVAGMFTVNAANASDAAYAADPEVESPSPADVLLTASVRSSVTGRTYQAVSTTVTLIAVFAAVSIATGEHNKGLLNPAVFVGFFTGTILVFVLAGLIIRAVRLTGTVLRKTLDDPEEDVYIKSLRGLAPVYVVAIAVPLAIGFIAGVSGLIAFIFTASITGVCLIYTFNNSGKYFDRMAVGTLGTVIKFMAALALVLAPFFMNHGGLF